MTSEMAKRRYEMVNVRPGYVVVEHDLFSRDLRTTFVTEPPLPREEYREGKRTWRAAGVGQTFRFDVRDAESGSVVSFSELLGLVYYAVCGEETPVHDAGRVAHENGISVYVAITYESPDAPGRGLSFEKLRILNQMYNERLRTRDKKILILPDLFGLHRTISYGQIMIDFGLTSMEAEG